MININLITMININLITMININLITMININLIQIYRFLMDIFLSFNKIVNRYL
jgi:hypothetical protein